MSRVIRTPIRAVYAIVAADSRHYVGGSINVQKRWNDHRSDLNRGRHANKKLAAAWRANAAGFTFRILERVAGAASLRACEQWWIDTLSSVENGLNVAPEAGSVRGLRHSPEVRARIGAAGIGRPVSSEYRAEISRRMMGLTLCLGRHGEKCPASRLASHEVIEIRQRSIVGETRAALGRAFGISESTVRQIITRKSWRHLP